MGFVTVPDRARETELERIMAEHGSALLRMCYVILRDASLAEDAVQDTFFKAYKALATFRHESGEKAWLMRIAVNTCRDYLRTAWMRRVDRRVSLDHLPEIAVETALPDSTVVDEIMRLPAKSKEVILLRYYAGMKQIEIAGALGISQETVKARLRRANQRLHQRLEGWYYDE